MYILLTARSGRPALQDAKTLILDEILAVANDKRGSHVSISVESLWELAENSIPRLGLAATQRSIDEVARFLMGTENISADGTPDCLIVDSGRARSIDLDLTIPETELVPIATHELWGETLDTISGLVKQPGTNLVFVITRRLVERIAHQLAARLGDDAVVAHHGSLSRSTRLAAEEKLKKSLVKVSQSHALANAIAVIQRVGTDACGLRVVYMEKLRETFLQT